ncbi:MAG: hypothetical protein J5802_01635 [Butyrivibrio sp.]|nr:hypothetical protein [Butyrivibrio sp.]
MAGIKKVMALMMLVFIFIGLLMCNPFRYITNMDQNDPNQGLGENNGLFISEEGAVAQDNVDEENQIAIGDAVFEYDSNLNVYILKADGANEYEPMYEQYESLFQQYDEP